MSGEGWPTGRDYIDWAQRQGCAVTIEPAERDGRSLHALTITSPTGEVAREIVMELSDPLMSSTIARLDRRLRMKSHLFR